MLTLARTIWCASFLYVIWGVCACSSAQQAPKEPEKCKLQKVKGAIIASPLINQSEEGEPRPVQLRLYQIKSDVSFQNSTFEQIWKDDKTTLGEDLVKVEEFPVYPNTRSNVQLERDPNAQFIVAAALFREPKGKSWFASFELPPPPTAGSCGATCVGDNCDGGTPATPRIYVWIDRTRVEDGAEHADDSPQGRTSSTPGGAGESCDPSTSGSLSSPLSGSDLPGLAPSKPEVPNLSTPESPTAPSSPKLPSAPKVP